MSRFFLPLIAGLFGPLLAWAAPPLTLPASTPAILDHIYQGQSELALAELRELRQKFPEEPLVYILEAEALWWRIWCTSAEYKYGMTLARHREKLAADQHYLDLAAKAQGLAEAQLKFHESAQSYFYAGMAEALLARLYGLRWENRNTARSAVKAREYFSRALALDPQLADADMGLGLYDYYVDTLSPAARLLRFFMLIPGGSKPEGIRRLRHAIAAGQITPCSSRFYLAINLHNYDQRYQEALETLTPLVQQYPGNPLFLVAQGDLLAKLGRATLALAAYHSAERANATFADLDCRQHLGSLIKQAQAAVSGQSPPAE